MAFSHHKVTVILRSVDKADTVPERNLLLRPGVSILVGRASKNEAKGMVASSDNAYIDSPVVSRKHAELTADFSGPSPLVYIADKDSMHGTKLNGNVLSDGRPRQLQSGDVLQFGADVVRDNDSYIAKSYQCNLKVPPSESSPSMFPYGVSAPSPVSSLDYDHEEGEEGEEGDFATEDDEDDDEAPEDEDDNAAPEKRNDSLVQPTGAAQVNRNPHIIYMTSTVSATWGSGTPQGHQSMEAPEDVVTPALTLMQNEAGRIVEVSRSNSPALSSACDSENSYSPSDPLSDEPQTARYSIRRENPNEEIADMYEEDRSEDEGNKSRLLDPYSPVSEHAEDNAASKQVKDVESPPYPELFDHARPQPFDFDYSARPRITHDSTPTVPFMNWVPPPSLPLQSNVYNGSDLTFGAEPGETTDFFDYLPPSPQALRSFQHHSVSVASRRSPAYGRQAEVENKSLPTPPVAPQDTVGPSPLPEKPQPYVEPPVPRLNKTLSIAEMVDAPSQAPLSSQQPLKRKADVLEQDEDIVPKTHESPSKILSEAAKSEQQTAAVQVTPLAPLATIDTQRPRKRLRGIISFASTVAAGVAVGAVAVVGGLAALPEGFFE